MPDLQARKASLLDQREELKQMWKRRGFSFTQAPPARLQTFRDLMLENMRTVEKQLREVGRQIAAEQKAVVAKRRAARTKRRLL